MQKNQLNNNSYTIWLTGLSGSGKTTIANALHQEFASMDIPSYVLDGDILRNGLNKGLGFLAEDRSENIRRASEVCRILNDAGVLVIAAFISPFVKDRKLASEIIGKGNFFEIYIEADIDTCISRDPKGLYQKAIKGLIPEFTGISSPYETPEKPVLKINTSKVSVKESVEMLIELLRSEKAL